MVLNVYGGFWWFSEFVVVSSSFKCLWWFWVGFSVCGGLRWFLVFVVVSRGLSVSGVKLIMGNCSIEQDIASCLI